MGFNKNSAKEAGKRSSRKGIANFNRSVLFSILECHAGNLSTALTELYETDKKGFINAYIALLPFGLAKLQPVIEEAAPEVKEPLQIKVGTNEFIFNG